MPPLNRYERIEDNGVTFVFKHDVDAPELLHIFARHLMEPADAIDTWFDGIPVWNTVHRRFETRYNGVGIYWYWIDESKQVVMIASCFSL